VPLLESVRLTAVVCACVIVCTVSQGFARPFWKRKLGTVTFKIDVRVIAEARKVMFNDVCEAPVSFRRSVRAAPAPLREVCLCRCCDGVQPEHSSMKGPCVCLDALQRIPVCFAGFAKALNVPRFVAWAMVSVAPCVV
jgi:hypothetical protein